MRVNKLLKATSQAALLSLACGAVTHAYAQTSYYQGTVTLSDPVTVDMGVLEGLGAPANLAELLKPSVLLPSMSQTVAPPKPQSVAPLQLNNAARPTSSLEGTAPPTAVRVAPAPTPMKIETPKAVAAPSSAPTSGIVGAAPSTPTVAKAPVAITNDAAKQEAKNIEEMATKAPTETTEPMKTADTPAAASIAPAEVEAEVTQKIAAIPSTETAAIANDPAPLTPVAETPAIDTEASKSTPSAAEVETIMEETVPATVEKVVPPVEEAAKVVETPAPAVEAPVEAEAQVASIDPNAVMINEDGTVSIKFTQGSSDLPAGVNGALDDLALKLSTDEDLRVQLWGYAEVQGESPSQARRLSLFRALAVRTYLMKQGVRSTRMDVRALGDKVENGPTDRVDVVFPK